MDSLNPPSVSPYNKNFFWFPWEVKAIDKKIHKGLTTRRVFLASYTFMACDCVFYVVHLLPFVPRRPLICFYFSIRGIQCRLSQNDKTVLYCVAAFDTLVLSLFPSYEFSLGQSSVLLQLLFTPLCFSILRVDVKHFKDLWQLDCVFHKCYVVLPNDLMWKAKPCAEHNQRNFEFITDRTWKIVISSLSLESHSRSRLAKQRSIEHEQGRNSWSWAAIFSICLEIVVHKSFIFASNNFLAGFRSLSFKGFARTFVVKSL